MPDYREALRIELHDAGVTVHSNMRSDLDGSWREFAHFGRGIKINGDGLAEVLHRTGLIGERIKRELGKREYDLLDVVNFQTGADGSSNRPVEGGHDIEKLEVAVEGAQLVHIRATCSIDEGGSYVLRNTYSGSFTVWWAEDIE